MAQINSLTESPQTNISEDISKSHPDLNIVLNSITDIVKDMHSESSLWHTDQEAYKQNIIKEHPEIYATYPAIFNVIFNPQFNNESMERLNYMISMARRVKQNDIPEHDASVAVGQRLVDDIVKPQLTKH